MVAATLVAVGATLITFAIGFICGSQFALAAYAVGVRHGKESK